MASPAQTPSRPLLPRRLSPAAIARYRQCPRALYFQYVARVPRRERPNPQLMLGSAVHAALDKFFGLRAEDRQPPVEILHRCLRAVWKQHRRADTFVTVDEERYYGEQGLEQLTRFAGSFDTSVVPLARERWVSTRLSNGVDIFGKLDRCDPGRIHADRKGSLDVVDYKTGRWVVDSEDLAGEPAAQAYLLATEDEYGREVERVRFLYLAHGIESRWEPEREDVDAARDELVAVTTRMLEDDDLAANPGEHCGRCAFAHVCPDAGRVELVDLEIDDDLAF
jgi:putative RecB family exonuclease